MEARKMKNIPSMSLKKAIGIIEENFKRNGKELSFEIVSELTGISSKSSNINIKIKDLQMFRLVIGTLTKPSLSQLALDIVSPKLEADAMIAKQTAMQNIEIYRKLLEKYDKSPLPENKFLSNILIREFAVSEKEASEVINMFIESGIEAGLIINKEGRHFVNIDQSFTYQMPATKEKEPLLPVRQKQSDREITPTEGNYIFIEIKNEGKTRKLHLGIDENEAIEPYIDLAETFLKAQKTSS